VSGARAFAAALALAALAAPADAAEPGAEPRPAEPRASLADISDEVMCLVCGVPLDHALENPQAQREREFIRRLIAEGRSKEEIKDALVAQYGENVLATPGTEGFDLAAWLVPGAAFVTAALAIGIALRRWRHRNGSAEPPAGGQGEPDAADAKRLDEDLARYEL
jgi:cytochrome c-type biogenesis protein CcmH/NrfF